MAFLNENIKRPKCINEYLKQVKLLENRFCMNIIIGLVHYPNHTFLQNCNSLKVNFVS